MHHQTSAITTVGRRHRANVRITHACAEVALAASFQDVTLAQLCDAAGVGERRIRQAFQECYGVSPTAHLRLEALRRVRAALLERPLRRDAVSRAAADFGFWHLSRFAAQYREAFGECPSETVARRLRAETASDLAA